MNAESAHGLPRIDLPARAAMSIDVEDWFQVQNLAQQVSRDSWDSREQRVVSNTSRMLSMLEESHARATCFVLGWVAERHPGLVRDIASAGHEVASHGYGHELIYEIGPDRFREDVRRAKGILESITGHRVEGYRAPNFSITDWALDILMEEGHAYDSSSFPVVAHDRYGRLTNAPRGRCAYQPRAGIDEVCVSSLRIAGKDIPWGGGAWFRLFPYPVFAWGVERIVGSGAPFVFYIHPWEIDPGQPRIRGLRWSHARRHYTNLAACGPRWSRLLKSRPWCTIRELRAGASRVG